jgi:hypothetical protein
MRARGRPTPPRPCLCLWTSGACCGDGRWASGLRMVVTSRARRRRDGSRWLWSCTTSRRRRCSCGARRACGRSGRGGRTGRSGSGRAREPCAGSVLLGTAAVRAPLGVLRPAVFGARVVLADNARAFRFGTHMEVAPHSRSPARPLYVRRDWRRWPVDAAPLCPHGHVMFAYRTAMRIANMSPQNAYISLRRLRAAGRAADIEPRIFATRPAGRRRLTLGPRPRALRRRRTSRRQETFPCSARSRGWPHPPTREAVRRAQTTVRRPRLRNRLGLEQD